MKAPEPYQRRHSESDRQAGPVSQNQICQREHDVEFCGLFSQPSVLGLLEYQQPLHHTEDVLYLGGEKHEGRFSVQMRVIDL